MTIGTITLVLIIMVLADAFSHWPRNRLWDYNPSSGLWLVFMVVLVMIFIQRL